MSLVYLLRREGWVLKSFIFWIMPCLVNLLGRWLFLEIFLGMFFGVGSSILETFPNQNVKFILVTSSCNFVIVFLSECVDNKCINMNSILNFCKAGFLGYEHCRRCGVACYNILQGVLSFFDFLGNTLVDPNTEKDDEE